MTNETTTITTDERVRPLNTLGAIRFYPHMGACGVYAFHNRRDHGNESFAYFYPTLFDILEQWDITLLPETTDEFGVYIPYTIGSES